MEWLKLSGAEWANTSDGNLSYDKVIQHFFFVLISFGIKVVWRTVDCWSFFESFFLPEIEREG